MSDPQVEVRLITYRRPAFLKRALDCLIRQTHANWKAIVFDDSPDGEGRAIVRVFADPRITYSANPCNLGMVRNLSQAFAAGPYFPASTHACILEDDNTLDASWLEESLGTMDRTTCSVTVRNFRVVDVLEDGETIANPSEPMRQLYGDLPRMIPFDERVREAFFSFTIGTSCYFWSLHSSLDLSFSEERYHGPVMEAGRAICFREPCWYEPTPLSTFSRFVCKSQTPRSESPASKHTRRIAKVSEIQFTKRLMAIWTDELGRSMREIIEYAIDRADRVEATQRLAEAGCLPALLHLNSLRSWKIALKSMIVGILYRTQWARSNSTVTTPTKVALW